MSFNTQNTSKFAVFEFGAGTQPQAQAKGADKGADKKKGKEKKTEAAKADSSSGNAEGEGKVIENLILTTLATDGK